MTKGVDYFGSIFEEWKEVEGYDGLYYVSNMGRVLAKVRIGSSGGYLKPMVNHKGYMTVELRKPGGERRTWSLHQLVARHFIPNPEGYVEINHKDEDKTNNCAENLEWCSRQYNVHYGTGIQRNAEQRMRVVLQYDYNGTLVREWRSVKEVAHALGIDSSNISRCCNGSFKTCLESIFMYKDDKDLEKNLAERVAWANSKENYRRKKKVLQLKLSGELVRSYESVREAARFLGVNSGIVCHHLKEGDLFLDCKWRYATPNPSQKQA